MARDLLRKKARQGLLAEGLTPDQIEAELARLGLERQLPWSTQTRRNMASLELGQTLYFPSSFRGAARIVASKSRTEQRAYRTLCYDGKVFILRVK